MMTSGGFGSICVEPCPDYLILDTMEGVSECWWHEVLRAIARHVSRSQVVTSYMNEPNVIIMVF